MFRLLAVLKRDGEHQHKGGGLLANVRLVVLDEADLLFAYGYRSEMERIRAQLPSAATAGRR
jgi:superfamily II DNA/RNA helicase